jgi:hypothetical protein
MTSGRWALDRNITGTSAKPGCRLIRWHVSTPFSPSKFQSQTIRSGGQVRAAVIASSAVAQQRHPNSASVNTSLIFSKTFRSPSTTRTNGRSCPKSFVTLQTSV